MKKSGVCFWEDRCEMRISQSSSKELELAFLHGFMVIRSGQVLFTQPAIVEMNAARSACALSI